MLFYFSSKQSIEAIYTISVECFELRHFFVALRFDMLASVAHHVCVSAVHGVHVCVCVCVCVCVFVCY